MAKPTQKVYATKFNPTKGTVTLCNEPLGSGTEVTIDGETCCLFDNDADPTRFAAFKIKDYQSKIDALISKYSEPVLIKELVWDQQKDGVLWSVRPK
tara:strand:- start:254 stop:544 length:291 start_codon:yes stop_codon:yes gene_type:complete